MIDGLADRIGDGYSRILAEYPVLVLALIIASAILAGMWASHLKMSAYDYKHVLTDDPVASAMFELEDKFSMSSTSVIILVTSKDVRDPSTIEYMNKIDTAVQTIPGVAAVNSPAEMVKRVCGKIPKTYANSIVCFKKRIVIKPINIDMQNRLMNISIGLAEIGELLETESSVLSKMSDGLNMSAYALSSISQNLGESASAMRAPSFSFGSELGEALENLYISIMMSSATPEQKQEELSYLNKIEESLGEIQSVGEESSQGMKMLRTGLSDTSSALVYISSGVQNASKGVYKFSYMDKELSTNLIQISNGLRLMIPYIAMFEQEDREQQVINPFKGLVSPDNRTAQITVELYPMPRTQQKEIGIEIERVVSRIQKPPHTTVQFTGAPIMSREIETSSKQDMSRTSSLSMIAIIFIVVVLFRSLKNGLTSLMAIVFGSIWTYGVIVLLGISISQTSSGALSMIFGVGIDFGIQVVNRFREEIQKKDLQKALKDTLINVGKPMTVTAISALIGFNAMSLGQLKVMGELGHIMSMGVLFSYIAALVVVPAVLSVLYGHSHHKKR